MAKTEKELSELKEKLEDLRKELDSLSDEELEKVAGGIVPCLVTRRSDGKRGKKGLPE